jgi:hypothetical protein
LKGVWPLLVEVRESPGRLAVPRPAVAFLAPRCICAYSRIWLAHLLMTQEQGERCSIVCLPSQRNKRMTKRLCGVTPLGSAAGWWLPPPLPPLFPCLPLLLAR